MEDQSIRDEVILKVDDFKSPVAAAQSYLARIGASAAPRNGAFAVAAPETQLQTPSFTLTNNRWRFSIEEIRRALGFERFSVINDFHALALGVLEADPASIHRIGGGIEGRKATKAVIGPGTGLGVASLIFDPQHDRYLVAPGEGGHVTFPATNAREFALVEWLLRSGRYTHVSAERVCSGKGLVNVYDAIRGVDGAKSLPDLEPEEITARALEKRCAACSEALTLMIAFLGRIAGNLALTILAAGGVYFAGGILPKLGVSYLQNSRLRGEFTAKGRFTAFADEIPTYLVTDPFLALRGLGIQARSA
jgi:glucokinase